MKAFTEHGAGKQLGILAAMMGIIGTPVGGLILYAADAKLDEKYATDSDVLAVQQTVETQVTSIKTTVELNTKTVRATAASVDGLTLIVMDLQIDKVEGEIRNLERDKRQDGAAWNERDEDSLRDKQKALNDLNLQRGILFQRLIAAATVTP